MKSLSCIVAVAFFCSCNAQRQVQVEMMSAQLVKIDTIYRYPEAKQVLTWRCSTNVEYVSFEPINSFYQIGYRTPILVRR